MGWREGTWRQGLEPARMQRVAIVAVESDLRQVLAAVADTGLVDLDTPDGGVEAGGEVTRVLQRLPVGPAVAPRLARQPPDLETLLADGRGDLLAGEADLRVRAGAAVSRHGLAAVAGWVPASDLDALERAVGLAGGSVVSLPVPPHAEPPTLLRPRSALHGSFAPLVQTYATVPYRDVDPTVLAGLAYVAMFGVMFGDVGHGALLVLAGLTLRSRRIARLDRLRRLWPFVVGAGTVAMLAGFAYGEFFGPTGVVPVFVAGASGGTGDADGGGPGDGRRPAGRCLRRRHGEPLP